MATILAFGERKFDFITAMEEADLRVNTEDIDTIDYNALCEIQEIWNDNFDNSVPFSEAFSDTFKSEKFERFKQNIANAKDLKNQWKKLADNFITHKWIERYINQQQKDMLMKYHTILCEDDVTWSNYRKAFVQICKFMGLPNKGIVIEWIEFQNKGKEGDVIAVRYSKGIAKVNIPVGIKLTHQSPIDNLKELIPSFKSKTKGKFFYDSPRIYFSIHKKLNPFKFGIDKHAKLAIYQTKEDIYSAYIDPTYILFRDRSVFVETNNSIKVDQVAK